MSEIRKSVDENFYAVQLDHKRPLLWAILGLITLALPFSEWRVIKYQFYGPRSISYTDLVFFLVTGAVVVMIIRKNGFLALLKRFASLWYILLPMVMMALVYTDNGAFNNVRPSFTRFLLFGLGTYMLLSALAMACFAEEKTLTFVKSYIVIVSLFFIPIYIFTRFVPLTSFMYGETPSLHFPFSSPNQMALFAMLNLLLGVGVALALRKFYLLYIAIPLMVLVIFQTGSRSNVLLLVAADLAFIGLILLNILRKRPYRWINLFHLLSSTGVAVVLIFISIDDPRNLQDPNARAASLFGTNLKDFMLGKGDDYRSKVWKIFMYRAEAIEKYSKDGNEDASLEKLAPPELVGGAHNAYLDVWLNWGKWSLGAFLLFLSALLLATAKLLWKKRDSKYFPFYGALLIGLGVIVGAIFANPLLHLKFVWVFFGLIIAFLLNHMKSNKDCPLNN